MSEDLLLSTANDADQDGHAAPTVLTTPVSDTVRVACVVHPTTVVPIIFVPGIMGSNLKDTESGDSIWNVNSTFSILWQWAFRSAKTRQRRLVYTRAAVDDRGAFPGESSTVKTQKLAKTRGWGTVSNASYSDFLIWLDDAMNSAAIKDGKLAEPFWESLVGRSDLGEQWGAEREFHPITAKEKEVAWANYYCPVHACGYNWLQSNGQSGKDLNDRIDKVIAYWNDPKNHKGCEYTCEKVILVTHSMGGLVSRAAVHPDLGGAADKVLGIVHGVMPATGAAAAYHHVRSGYSGVSKIVLGRNAAQVTAIFANSPGAMELLPNKLYPPNWLRIQASDQTTLFRLPENDPYQEIYTVKDSWWRLVDPDLIDPIGGNKDRKDSWDDIYMVNLRAASNFHSTVGSDYHAQTYVHYGSDRAKNFAYNYLSWACASAYFKSVDDLRTSLDFSGSNPVNIKLNSSEKLHFSIVPEDADREVQTGDSTVPTISGEAPNKQGGENVRQSFKLAGFEHQDSYKNTNAKNSTLYSVIKILQVYG